MKTVKARISGRVQGVWFRAWTKQQARLHGLDGWVRNRPDGTVEALFAGPDAKVDRMIAECHVGPPDARVDAVSVEPAIADPGDAPGFTTRATG
jgi:acylphosphatase